MSEVVVMLVRSHMLLEVTVVCCFFFFNQKTAYEWRISDWSSDVCASDLQFEAGTGAQRGVEEHQRDGLSLERIAGRMALEARGLGQQRVDLGAGQVLGVEEVFHLGRERREGRRERETKKPSTGAGLFSECGKASGLPSERRFRSARARRHARRHAGGAEEDNGGGALLHGRRIAAWRPGAAQPGTVQGREIGSAPCRASVVQYVWISGEPGTDKK